MPKVTIDPSIFRGYDIRGITGKQLNEEVITHLTQAYATFLYRRQINECVVGHDMRETSPAYHQTCIAALRSAGIHVIDIGLTLTQIVYFAQYYFRSKGAVMITASHNPREFNGMKLAVGFSDTLITEEIQEVRAIAESGKFEKWDSEGSYQKADIFSDYTADLFKRVPLKDSGLKVVIDSSKATTGKFLPEILRQAGCEVIEQNTDLDPTFPLGVADPTESKVLNRLAEGVKKAKADIGFAYDTDGDRVGIVDEDGTPLWNDMLVALFAQDILHFLPGSPIVFNALCSKTTSDTIVAAGGKPVMWKTGHSFIKAKVREVRAPFGGELSGHFFFMDNFYGHDDGAFATLRLLAYLKREGQSLKEAMTSLPRYISSPEIKLGLADAVKFQLIDRELTAEIKKLLPKAAYVTIDGIRADTADEMAVIRASQNGPYITIKFEGKTQAQYDRLKDSLKTILKKYDQIDWTVGTNTHAFK